MKSLNKVVMVCICLSLISKISVSQEQIQKQGKSVYTLEEIRRRCGIHVDKKKMKEVLENQEKLYKDYLHSKGLQKVATSMSWRSYMGPVNNQGDCGDCWAHSATSTLEGAFNIILGSGGCDDLVHCY